MAELTNHQRDPSGGASQFSDSDPETSDHFPQGPQPSLSGRYTPDIFSGVYRSLKKLPSVKLSRTPSRLNLRNIGSASARSDSPPSAVESSSYSSSRGAAAAHAHAPLSGGGIIASGSSSSAGGANQHARNLSITPKSLDKPLPQTPQQASWRTGTIHKDDDDAAPTPRHTDRFLESRLDTRLDMMEQNNGAQAGHLYGGGSSSGDQYSQDVNSSMSSLASADDAVRDATASRSNAGTPSGPSPGVSQSRTPQQQASNSNLAAAASTQSSSSSHLSGLMCNVHRTTGREPHPLVGATTTILGDKLYVFGGRILSRSRPAPLTADLYELDLIRRHWTKLQTTGDVPPPRYFHSMCALGDTKMVCYGGMSPVPNQPPVTDQQQQPEVTVMSDIYIYDVPTRTWTFVPTVDPPQGRYAHCACILPSSASFSSHRAPLSALQHNPSSGTNEGRIGIDINGSGGAEMVVVGGQDGANHYIEQISVFNLRNLKWTSTQPLGKSCGAYRSVATPLPASVTSKIGKAYQNGAQRLDSQDAVRDPGSAMLIYSNYNFLDVKLELQIRTSDGSLHERPMSGTYSPPGLRFPNGGIIDTHFIVSGTYLTSSKQEYALWALDLRTLSWTRIDAGANVFSQGSWNRGVLWNRRNTFVILGNRKRSLVDDYNHRRINFSNVCMVELEAFGFYDNPRKVSPLSGFISASSPYSGPGLSLSRKAGYTAGGRSHSRASEELGEKALAMRELSDMDILCIGGERVSVNSRLVARRWGPYFVQLLREGTATQDGSDAATLRSGGLSSNPLRVSAITITPSNRNENGSNGAGAGGSFSGSMTNLTDDINPATINSAPTPRSLAPNSRPRCLYMPHTYLTVQALLHFVYTSSLPAPSSPLCTPQILCSLLQIARPYRVDGLLEAVVERLHSLLDSRNAAAVFNATAMAAGGGRGIDGSLNPNFFVGALDPIGSAASTSDFSIGGTTLMGDGVTNGSTDDLNLAVQAATGLSLNTDVPRRRPSSDEMSASTSASGSEWSSSELGEREERRAQAVWNGELSSVIGLQKRGLRGLMEGRRMRERTGTSAGPGMSATAVPGGYGQGPRVGLGIAGSQG